MAFEPLLAAWRADGGDAGAARARTQRQVEALLGLAGDDDGWRRLVEVFQRGRAFDSWLATDWPSGFDELLLCAPLCQLVQFECARCTVGARQESHSCAHPQTVFGRVGALLQAENREGLLAHLQEVLQILVPGSTATWDLIAGRARPTEG